MANDFWSIVTLVAMAGWVAAAIGFMFNSFPERNRFEARPAFRWGTALVVAYALWVVGLLNA